MVAQPDVARHDAVVLFPACGDLPEHEAVVHADIARRLADLMDVPFGGVYDARQHGGKHCYVVPSGTLIGPAAKEWLGVSAQSDLFGGYAGHAFIPTKAITHRLVGPHAERPAGWSEAFTEQVGPAVLPGYTAFCLADLKEAAQRLLDDGTAVRLKPVLATAGRGQVCLAQLGDLDAALQNQDLSRLAECGMVLETHLDQIITYSVGQVRLPGGLVASYIGTQCLTQDNHGEAVYGGSRLQFARGDYRALLQLPLNAECRQVVELARRYDAAADACFPGFFASRRNYDVAAGVDGKGRRQVGVLEQSWRIGGASRAEIAALEILASDPDCHTLQAETLELFGPDAVAPSHAIETYAGEDPDLGLIRKYVMVEAYGNKQ